MICYFLIIGAFISYICFAEGSCNSGWTSFGSNCYKFAISTGDWNACNSACSSLNAMMLCVKDAATNDWLWNQTGGGTSETWIGLSDISRNGTYTWVSGCSSTYTNWYPGQPDFNSNQFYAYYPTWGNKQWDNNQVLNKRCACQTAAPSTVAPSKVPTAAPSTVAPSTGPTAAPSRSCTTTVSNMGSCTLTSTLCCDTCTM